MKLLKTKKDREEFLTWIAFLKAGVFEQGRHRLQSGEESYCCLGVGCVVTIPEKSLNVEEEGQLVGGYVPRRQQSAPEWLQKVNIDFEARTGDTLSVLNDGFDDVSPTSHPKIADRLLEVYGEELFG